MPDLTGFPALDVAIGLAFMFFLLSTICSAINEGIAGVFGWRAKNLEQAVARLVGVSAKKLKERREEGQAAEKITKVHTGTNTHELGDHVTRQLFDHWRIAALVKDPNSKYTRNNRPSYIPAQAFSRALVEVIGKLEVVDPTDGKPVPSTVPAADDTKTPWQIESEKLMKNVTDRLDHLPEGQLRTFLAKAAAAANHDIDRFRLEIEGAFDETMGRASGWYKRHVQVALALIAVGVTLALNVDSLRVADRLWKNPELRGAVAAQAVKKPESTTAQTVSTTVNKVKELNLPIGWGGGNAPSKGTSKDTGDQIGNVVLGVLRRIPGWLATIIALSLGAPFWFDVLSRLARLRNSGLPEQPRALSDKAGVPQRTEPGAGAAAPAVQALGGAPAVTAATTSPAPPGTRL